MTNLPNKVFTLNCFSNDNINWETIQKYFIALGDNFQICLENEDDIKYAKQIGVKYFFVPLIRDFYTLNRYISLGVCAARITSPLLNHLDDIRRMNLDIELRIYPNMPGIKTTKGCTALAGGWIRPEDIESISDVIDVIEFSPKTQMKREQALFRIYAEQHSWSGDLDLLIDDFNIKGIMNRMIPPEFQERRSNCYQKCQYSNRCHYCDLILKLANPEFLQSMKE